MDNFKFFKIGQAILILALFTSNAVFPQKLTHQKHIDTTNTNVREIIDLFDSQENISKRELENVAGIYGFRHNKRRLLQRC